MHMTMNVSMEMMMTKGSTIPMITIDDTYVYTIMASNKEWENRIIERLSC